MQKLSRQIKCLHRIYYNRILSPKPWRSPVPVCGMLTKWIRPWSWQFLGISKKNFLILYQFPILRDASGWYAPYKNNLLRLFNFNRILKFGKETALFYCRFYPFLSEMKWQLRLFERLVLRIRLEVYIYILNLGWGMVYMDWSAIDLCDRSLQVSS